MERMELPLLRGSLPPNFPRGTYYRVGPDQAESGHLLDGQGRVDKMVFRDGIVRLTSRRIVTATGGRPTFAPGGIGIRLHNPANTSLLLHDDRLFALWEGGLPTEIDKETLETLQQDVLIANTRPGLPFSTGLGVLDGIMGMGGETFCAHPVQRNGCLFALTSSIRRDRVAYRVSEVRGSRTLRSRAFDVEGFTAVHGGFAVTEDLYAIFAPSLSLDTLKYACGGAMADCVSQDTKGTRLVVIDRFSCTSPQVLNLGSDVFVTHIANAYQSGKEIVIDAVASGSLASLRAGRNVRLVRFETKTGDVSTRVLHEGPVEFPATNMDVIGHTNRFVYACASPWGWIKHDVETGRTLTVSCCNGPHTEPVIVPTEEGCWLVGVAFHRSGKKLCVVDAQTMRTRCVYDARGVNALGLHGTWVSSL